MKSLIILFKQVLTECGLLVGTDTTRDFKTVSSRLKTEGLSFLTITLPSFCKEFERTLSVGHIHPSDFPGFKRTRGSGHLPAFLQGFTGLVFDRSTGVLLDVPSTEAIRDIRQICLLFSKIELPSPERREALAFQQYVQCERELYEQEELDSEGRFRPLRRVFIALFGDVLCRLDQFVYDLDDSIIPKHGPGSTADGLGANERWNLSTWTERLESILPAWFMTVPNEKWAGEANAYQQSLLEPGMEPPVRVITVPKTMKTPRIIAMEPAHMQYVQQALKRYLVEGIESDPLLSNLIRFSDQTPNQELARLGSRSGLLATLDLQEASDRVSNLLVLDMFEPWPHLSAAIQACRTTHADVPRHGIIPLTKFASMGSALTFPIEAMMFLTVIIYSALGGKELSTSAVRALAVRLGRGLVSVYGDDLIVPVDLVPSVTANLELFGFKVNASKSFWSGRFRESCGKEYYNGEDVSIVKVRQQYPKSRKHVPGVVGLSSVRNQLYASGLWQTARYLDEELSRILRYYPTVNQNSPVVGRLSYCRPDDCDFRSPQVIWHKDYHYPAFRGWAVVGRPPIDKIGDVAALQKVLVQNASTTSVEGWRSDDRWAPRVVERQDDHLEHAGRPKALRLSLRWVELI